MKLWTIREALMRGHLNAGECQARELASEAASLLLDREGPRDGALPAAQELAERAASAHAAYAPFAAAVRGFVDARHPGRAPLASSAAAGASIANACAGAMKR